jgi:glutaredoxin 3
MSLMIYSTGSCPRCKILKDAFQKAGLEYTEADMATSESRASMMTGGCFSLSAPVLQVGEEVYGPDQLFDSSGNLLAEKLRLVLDGQVPKWKEFSGDGGRPQERLMDCKIIWR